MEEASVRALGRVALLLRGIGALWLVLLVATSGLTGQLTEPGVAWGVAAVGVGWAAVWWRAGWADALAGRWSLLAGDLAVVAVVSIAPRLLGETAAVAGGYPFAALLVGLAVAGRAGVAVAASALAVVTGVALALSGAAAASSTISNLLFYVLAAVSLDVGWRLVQVQQGRARAAEAALAVQQERARTAAHLHDSVLQTLALVHRRADEPDAIRSLVRGQERQLRDWLFAPAEGLDSAHPDAGGRSLRVLLEEHAERVQADTGVTVRVVCVGGAGEALVAADVDAGAADGVGGLVQAAREAVLNAARHSGATAVDVFAEQDDGRLVVYVRDRGRGFELDGIAADRHGVRGSIIGRMARLGGSGEVRTAPGRGTEVELRL